MADSNLGNLSYSLSIDDKTKTQLPAIIEEIQKQLNSGMKSVSIGSVTLDPNAAQQLIAQINDVIKKASATVSISADTSAAAAQIQQAAQSMNLRATIDTATMQQDLTKKVFDIKIQVPASEVNALITALGEKLNGKSVKVTVSPTMDKAVVDNLRNEIASRLEKSSIKLRNFTFTISAREAAAEIQKQLTTPVDVQLAAKAINVLAEVKNIALQPEAVTQLMNQINTALQSQNAKLGKIDTSELQAALAQAISKSIEIAKPTIMQRIREALTGGVQKIKLDVDANTLAKNFAQALKNSTLKIDNVTLSTRAMIADIKQALKKEKFTIEIAVNKMQVATAVQEALKKAGYNNLGYSASDARLDRNAREAKLASVRLQREQALLAKAHADAERAAQRNANAHAGLTRNVNNTTLAVNQLGGVIGNVFTVYAVKNFAQEIINIGGELEKMKLAMGSIMGDTYKASTIFQQVSDLSMVSPFDVQDLVTYTKQLNAFGIKYNELYDTTKRLSDIAAAVGVSFGRIAYEFGQTSARGWLDGRELRMFANSGIPLLQKLADYYTRTTQAVVSAAQVREMVTKRQVSFGDVKSVLWEMTNEGGEFYKMQEVMAESLSAKWRNLANDWNLMMGSIAESGVGDVLKKLAESLMTLVENWRLVASAISPVVTWLTIYKTAQMLANRQAMAGAVAQRTFGEATVMSAKYLKGLVSSITKNPFNWVMLAASALAATLAHFNDKCRESEERIDKVYDKASQGYKNLKSLLESDAMQFKPTNEAEYKTALDGMKDAIKDYAPDWQDIFVEAFGDGTKEGIKTVAGQYDFLKGKLEELKISYSTLIDLKEIFEGANKDTGNWMEIGNETALTNLAQADKKLTEFSNKALEISSKYPRQVEKFISKLAEANADYADWLSQNIGKSPVDKLKKAFQDFFGQAQYIAARQSRYFSDIKPLSGFASSLINDLKTAEKDVDQLATNIENRVLALKSDTYDPYDPNSKRSLRMEVDVALTEGNIKDPVIRNMIHNALVGKGLETKIENENYVEINTNNPEEENNDKKDHQLEKWRERQKLIKEAYKEYKKWLDVYHDEQKAIAKTKENPLFADLDVDPSKLKENLNQLFEEIKDNTKERRALKLTVSGDVFNIDYDKVKEQAEKAVKILKESIEKEAENFDLYKLFLKNGASPELAKEIAYGSKAIWDEVAEAWASQLYTAMLDKTGDVGLSYSISFDMAEEEAQKFFGKHGDDGTMYELWKAVKDRIEKTGVDYYKSLAESMGGFANIDSRIANLIEEQNKEIQRLIESKASADVIAAVRQKHADEISKLKKELFEGSDVYKKLQEDTTNMSLTKLTQLRNLTREVIDAINNGTTRMDGNGKILHLFQYDGKDYEIAEEDLQKLIEKLHKLMKKANNSTEAFKRMWSGINDDGGAMEFGDYAKDLQTISSDVEKIGKQFADLFGQDTKAGRLATQISACAGAIGDCANAAQKFASGDILGGISAVLDAIKKVTDTFGADYTEYDRTVKQYQTLITVWDSIIAKKKEYIGMSWGTETKNAADEAIRAVQAAIAVQQELAKARLEAGASAGSHSMNYRMWKGSYGANGKTWSDVAKDIEKKYGVQFKGMEDMLSMDADTLTKIMHDYPDLWASMDGDFRSYLENIIKYGDELDEITKTMRESLTDTTWDELRDGFDSLVKDMESTWDDFIDNFEESLYNAIVNQQLTKILGNEKEGVLADYYKAFADAMEDGVLTETEVADLRRKYEEIAKQIAEIRGQASETSGWTGETETSGKLSSSISGMTEDTAELLGAYVNGIRGDVAIQRAMIEQIAMTHLPMVSATVSAQLSQLTMQTEYLRQINDASLAMQTAVESIDERFARVVDVDRVRMK